MAYVVLILLLFSGCVSIKPSSPGSGKNHFETFYVGEAGTQYFIKPLLFVSEQPKDQLWVDFTFRYRNEIKDSVLMNFSIKGPSLYKTMDSLIIASKNIEVHSHRVDLLFNEKSRSGYNSRFTTTLGLNDTKELFQNYDWQLTLHNSGQVMRYASRKRTHKVIAKLKEKVFILM